MKFIDKRRFKKLLMNQSEPLLIRLGSGDLSGYLTTGNLDQLKTIDVYTIRSETSLKKYAGFPKVLEGLNLMNEKHVKIHSLNDGDNLIVFFTDASVKKLIGYLVATN